MQDCKTVVSRRNIINISKKSLKNIFFLNTLSENEWLTIF